MLNLETEFREFLFKPDNINVFHGIQYSLRYYSQAIGGDPFTLGRVMVYGYDSLAD